MPVISVFSKLFGLITCEGWGLSAGFVLAEGKVQDKWGRSARAWRHQVWQSVRHCTMRCECFWTKRRQCASWFLSHAWCVRSVREVSDWMTVQQLCMTKRVRGRCTVYRSPFLNSASQLFSVDEVLTYNDSRKGSSQEFPNSEGTINVIDFWFPRRLQELLRALLRFLRSFCFTWVWLILLSCQILYTTFEQPELMKRYTWRMGPQPKRYSDKVVDLRRVQARWEVDVRQVRKTLSKRRKQCTCSV